MSSKRNSGQEKILILGNTTIQNNPINTQNSNCSNNNYSSIVEQFVPSGPPIQFASSADTGKANNKAAKRNTKNFFFILSSYN